VNSEITKITDADADWLWGWVLYDAACPLCCRWVACFERTLTLRGFDLAPLKSPWVAECLDLPEHELLSRMRLLTRDGREFTGADAVVFLARHIWWAWPLYFAARLPGAMPLLRRVYDTVARHCHCGGTCKNSEAARTRLRPTRVDEERNDSCPG
jgi:predicted DCC family thiol-disulfide oxidoreductase YuxK